MKYIEFHFLKPKYFCILRVYYDLKQNEEKEKEENLSKESLVEKLLECFNLHFKN